MAPRVHPCVCGVITETFSKMKHHREKCALWKARPNPLTLMIDRRRKSRREAWGDHAIEPCPHCHRRPDHHDSDCPNSQAEVVRRAALKRNKINEKVFEVFLRVLAKKYKDEGIVVVPVWDEPKTEVVARPPPPVLPRRIPMKKVPLKIIEGTSNPQPTVPQDGPLSHQRMVDDDEDDDESGPDSSPT